MAEEKKGTVFCPVCQGRIVIKKSFDGKKEIGVSCENYKWESGANVGSCDFQIFFNQDKNGFGRDLNRNDIKKLLAGETIVSPRGNKMTLDAKKESGFYTKIEYAPRAEDTYL